MGAVRPRQAPTKASQDPKIRRVELRRAEEERHRDGPGGRVPAEFWEDDFPDLVGRGTGPGSTA